jgi:hypothetical protein
LFKARHNKKNAKAKIIPFWTLMYINLMKLEMYNHLLANGHYSDAMSSALVNSKIICYNEKPIITKVSHVSKKKIYFQQGEHE